MLAQSEAYIYLSDRRKGARTDTYRSLSSFERPLFGKLLGFSEDTLLPGARELIVAEKPAEVILIPLVGGLELSDGHGESVFVSPGESFRLLAFPESRLSVVNPYEEDTISLVRILCDTSIQEAGVSHVDLEPGHVFPLLETDQLHTAFQAGLVKGLIGQYHLRSEDEYKPSDATAGLFVYVVQGAFEVQNRLLETGDALSLSGSDTLEFEALSEGALILVVEVG